MARLLAADIATGFPHLFDNVAVADNGAVKIEAKILDVPLEPEIRHHGGDDAATRHLAGPVPRGRDQSH